MACGAQAGLPADLFAVVQGRGDVGAALAAAPADGVFFTGSLATGRAIAASVAPRMARLQLELGGKDPSFVAEVVRVFVITLVVVVVVVVGVALLLVVGRGAMA